MALTPEHGHLATVILSQFATVSNTRCGYWVTVYFMHAIIIINL